MGCDNWYGNCGYRRGGCCNDRPFYGPRRPYPGPGPFFGPDIDFFPKERPYRRGYRRPY